MKDKKNSTDEVIPLSTTDDKELKEIYYTHADDTAGKGKDIEYDA